MKAKSVIAVTVSGGLVEIADSINWPEGLELYVADYDVEDFDPDDLSYVDGHCSLSCYADGEGDSGQFAREITKAYSKMIE